MSNGMEQGTELSREVVAEQAGTPTPAELQQDHDRFLVVASRMAKAVKAVDALLCAAIGTRCNPQDFVRHSQGGKESFYLQATGCRKIRGFFGVWMRDRVVTVTPEKDGHYTYEVEGIAGSAFYDKLLGTDAQGGTQIDVFGSRSSSDPFFSKNDREPDQNDVKKAALSNFESRAINGLIGTQNLTREDLKRFGINADLVTGVEHKQGSEGGGNAALISEAQGKRLYAIGRTAKVEDTDARALLAAYGFQRSTNITRDRYEEICKTVEGGPATVKAKIAELAKAKPAERQPGEDDGSPEGAFHE